MSENNVDVSTLKLSTPEEAAEVMGVPITQVRNLVRQGRIPHYRLGHYIRIDINEALSSLRKEARTPADDAPRMIRHNARRKG